MITYKQAGIDGESRDIAVILDGRVAVRIVEVSGGFQYRPKGHYIKADSFCGEVYPTLRLCKQSLEAQ